MKRIKEKKLALAALELLKKRIDLYPNVIGLGLGQKVDPQNGNYFFIKIFVDKDTRSKSSQQSNDIPNFISIRLSKESRNLVKIPTEIEAVGDIELVAV